MSTIDDLKKSHGYKTSEDLFGVSQPSNFQCDYIDELQKYAGYIEKGVKVTKHDEYEDLSDKLLDIEYYIPDIQEGLEKLRDAIDSVRNWGQGWKDLFKKVIENENVDINKYI